MNDHDDTCLVDHDNTCCVATTKNIMKQQIMKERNTNYLKKYRAKNMRRNIIKGCVRYLNRCTTSPTYICQLNEKNELTITYHIRPGVSGGMGDKISGKF